MIQADMAVLQEILSMIREGVGGWFNGKHMERPAIRDGESESLRILYIVNAYIPTLQLRFLKPLSALSESGYISHDVLTEQEIKRYHNKICKKGDIKNWLSDRVIRFRPNVIIFCRYSGPYYEHLVSIARKSSIPTIYHIDDDLLHVPIELGLKKFEFHNHPDRLGSVRFLLNNVDLVHCPNQEMADRIRSYGFNRKFAVSNIPISAEVLVPAQKRPVKKIGYMGIDHAHDFEVALPSLSRILEEYDHIEFDIFGPIPKPKALDKFGSRVRTIPLIREYDEFMKTFSRMNWDIGICPLADTPFNAVKTHIKWVEYSAVGAAVIGTKGTIYDECCSDGRGLLVSTDSEWYDAFKSLISDESFRESMVARAQRYIELNYSPERLGKHIVDTIHDLVDS